jgi:hypothetical protein
LESLLKGIDPLANNRRDFVKKYIFPNCDNGLCGEKISDEILQSFK